MALRHAGEAETDTYLLACPGAPAAGCPLAASYPVDRVLGPDCFLSGDVLTRLIWSTYENDIGSSYLMI